MVRSGYLNTSLSNNPALSRGGHFVRVDPLEVICRQPDADRSKECHHRRHPFFTENRDFNVLITASYRLAFWNRNTASYNKNYSKTAPKITQNRITANPYVPLLLRFQILPSAYCGRKTFDEFSQWNNCYQTPLAWHQNNRRFNCENP